MVSTPVSIIRRTVAAGLLLAPLAWGCSSSSPPAPPSRSPAVQIADEPPYLCDLVPERSFRRITGATFPVAPRWSGVPSKHGGCLAFAAGRDAPLGIEWSFQEGAKILQRQQQAFPDRPRRTLPTELGKGFAVVLARPHESRRPNYVIALFGCGKKQPWLRIDFAPVSIGRDALQDMADIMRIAQRRFGELHNCMPRP